MYNADGKRVKQTLGSTVTNYLWDEASSYGDVVYEYSNTGGALASYVLGGTGLISQTRGTTTNYFLQDGQGSTRGLTSTTGTVTDTYSYTAFGESFATTGTTVNPYQYAGQQFDIPRIKKGLSRSRQSLTAYSLEWNCVKMRTDFIHQRLNNLH